MSRLRPVLVVLAASGAGALGTLAAGAATGMGGGELRHLAVLLAPAALATSVAAAAARTLLARASSRGRMLAVALIGTFVALANLGALAALMLVGQSDLAPIAVLLVYCAAAGAATAVVLARGQAQAIARLVATAERIAAGDLDARAGTLGAGRELDALGATLDRMAGRLAEAFERERAVEAQRRDLITAVSHDLRTPLAGLRATVEAIDDRVVEDTPTLRRYTAEMGRSVDSLVALVDDLFELVQLDAGAIEAESERALLRDVLDSALAACAGQASKKGLLVETRVEAVGDTPCSPRLARVLQNLLQNAIRHTPADGTVRVHARRGAGGLEVVVEDNGEGIEPAALERVFDPFWRGDASRSGDGTGLGLALSARIVEVLGGEIRVHSHPAEGSRFAVVVPG